MAEFLKTIKADQAAENAKIDQRTKAECDDAKAQIINQGVEREEEASRKKNLNVNIEAKIRKSSKIN